MGRAELHCPNGCDDGRFEALNAPLYVGRDGRYLDHEPRAATYRCARCASIAVDLAATARLMMAGEAGAVATLTCPSCGTVMLPPEDDPFTLLVECAGCQHRFAPEEGSPRLLSGGFVSDETE